MRIIAVDPGGTTGVATAWFRDGEVHGFRSFELAPMDAVQYVWHCIRWERKETVIVAEKYTITPATLKLSRQYDALEVIGALRFVAHMNQCDFELQMPSAAKGLATNERLAFLGWRRPSKGGHADDAARHLLVRAVLLNLIDPGTLP